jgi:hypothetical protein
MLKGYALPASYARQTGRGKSLVSRLLKLVDLVVQGLEADAQLLGGGGLVAASR